ncbi:MAG TPA: GAF domain-containing protein [Isosphaeraceae bacterium]
MGWRDEGARISSERHDEILAAFRAFASLAEDQLGRERTERAAAEAEASRALELVQELNTLIWAADAATGRYSFVNRCAEATLGYPVDQWLGEPGFWASYVHPEDREYVVANPARCLRQGKDVEFEYRAITASGRVVWFRESIRLVPAEGREPELRGQMWDITRRKKVETQLDAARRELAEQLDDMKYLHGLSTRLSPLMGLQSLVDEILAAAMSVQGAELGILRLYDPSAEELHVASSRGLPAAYLGQVARFGPGALACGAAVAAGKPVVVEDTETDPIYATSRDLARLGGYRATSSTPLIARSGEVLGTVASYFRQPHRPTGSQTRLVELYARQAADHVRVAGLLEDAGVDREAVGWKGRGMGNGYGPRSLSNAGGLEHAQP